MPSSDADTAAAILAGVAAVIGALVALVRELRNFRRDVVSAVEKHLEHQHAIRTPVARDPGPSETKN